MSLMSCSDKNMIADEPPAEKKPTGSISFYVSDYEVSGSVSRADGAHNPEYCWDDWNESKISTLDFLLVKDGIISAYKQYEYSDFNPANVSCSVPEVLFTAENGLSLISADNEYESVELKFEDLNNYDQIVIVANIDRNFYKGGMGGPAPTLNDFPTEWNISVNAKYFPGRFYWPEITSPASGGCWWGHSAVYWQDRKQNNIPMVGVCDIPEDVNTYSNIKLSLIRIKAKIRITLCNDNDVAYEPSAFKSSLDNFAVFSTVLPKGNITIGDNQIIDGDYSPIEMYLIRFYIEPGHGYFSDNVFDNVYNGNQYKDNGHVYYSYPSDWVDYSRVISGCDISNSDHDKFHSGAVYRIMDYDDSVPINKEREMYLIVKAPYPYPVTDESKEYYYKVPVNYRVAKINDNQCFTLDQLNNEVFPLYRVERNHFYDIKAIIDRPGAESLTGMGISGYIGKPSDLEPPDD